MANKFGGSKAKPGLADRLRQLNTRFGLRSKRCFLVWTKFTGEERGEGDEKILARVEILPTPKVGDLTSLTLNPFTAGTFPVGSVRIQEISLSFTYDELMGTKVPGQDKPIADPIDFFWELVEDGRGDAKPERARYRVLGTPVRNESEVMWEVILERTAEQFSRDGRSQIGPDP